MRNASYVIIPQQRLVLILIHSRDSSMLRAFPNISTVLHYSFLQNYANYFLQKKKFPLNSFEYYVYNNKHSLIILHYMKKIFTYFSIQENKAANNNQNPHFLNRFHRSAGTITLLVEPIKKIKGQGIVSKI